MNKSGCHSICTHIGQPNELWIEHWNEWKTFAVFGGLASSDILFPIKNNSIEFQFNKHALMVSLYTRLNVVQ